MAAISRKVLLSGLQTCLPGRVLRAGILALVSQIVVIGPLRAMGQCEVGWQEGFGGAGGVDGGVLALHVAPDGSVIVGGQFLNAGGMPANRIARLDGTRWSRLGTGMDGTVQSLTTRPDGEIIAGGQFVNAGGTLVNSIASWNGSTWAGLGNGLFRSSGSPWLDSLLTLPGGDIVAAGDFYIPGDVFIRRVARWNGVDWAGVGELPAGTISSAAILANGNLAIAANMSDQWGQATCSLWQWDGATWLRRGGTISGYIQDFKQLPNGDIIAVGHYVIVAGEGYIEASVRRWNGTGWTELGGIGGLRSTAITVTPVGASGFVVGGRFDYFSGSVRNIVYWNNNRWNSLGDVNSEVGTLCTLPNGDLMVGGYFTMAGNRTSSHIARYRFAVCAADFNCDDTVDMFDYLDFVEAFSQLSVTADVNRDGVVNFADYLEFVQRFSAGC